MKHAMVHAARLTVLLADHTRFGKDSVLKYADLKAIDVLVTDEGLGAADPHDLARGCRDRVRPRPTGRLATRPTSRRPGTMSRDGPACPSPSCRMSPVAAERHGEVTQMLTRLARQLRYPLSSPARSTCGSADSQGRSSELPGAAAMGAIRDGDRISGCLRQGHRLPHAAEELGRPGMSRHDIRRRSHGPSSRGRPYWSIVGTVTPGRLLLSSDRVESAAAPAAVRQATGRESSGPT